MYLFFDGVSTHWYMWLFDPERNLIHSENFEVQGNESSKIIPLIDTFLKTHNIQYSQIQNIITVVWPWSFTGIRSISLVVNTLSYIYPNISLTPVNFFDLYKNYPIVKSSSKRDLFVKYSESATIEIVKNEDFSSQNIEESIYGDIDIQRLWENISLNSDIDYEAFFWTLKLENNKSVSPLYIKKPNIS